MGVGEFTLFRQNQSVKIQTSTDTFENCIVDPEILDILYHILENFVYLPFYLSIFLSVQWVAGVHDMS